MGDILISNFDFSNIDLIKSIYDSLFNDPDLNKVLKSNSIWKLYQNRNLIVHKGGIVDQKYTTNTDTQLNVGEKLFVKPAEFEDYFSDIVRAVIATAIIANQKRK